MSKEIIFYGKPLRFSAGNHRYYWGGEYVPSVTTILKRLAKDALIQWAANCAVDHIGKHFNPEAWFKAAFDPAEEGHASAYFNEVLNEARKAHTVIRDTAGDVGTTVHRYARALLSSDERFREVDGAITPQALKALQAFEQWRDQHTIIPNALERRIFSAEMLYAGTMDFFGRIDGDLCALDFKTSNGVYDEAWYQLAGYERALIEELPATPPLTHWIVHLNKTTGECRAYRRGPDESAAARRVWTALVFLDKAIRDMPKMEKAA